MKKNIEKETYAILDGVKLKRTRGRSAVLAVLLNAVKPLTIEGIQAALEKEIHFVTLYRMLKQFVEANVVYQTDLRKGKAYYELQREHHHHITCTVCGTQEEITACLSELQNKALAQSAQFRLIDSHMLEFFSICNSCSKKS